MQISLAKGDKLSEKILIICKIPLQSVVTFVFSLLTWVLAVWFFLVYITRNWTINCTLASCPLLASSSLTQPVPLKIPQNTFLRNSSTMLALAQLFIFPSRQTMHSLETITQGLTCRTLENNLKCRSQNWLH